MAVFIIQFGAGYFSDRSWMFVCSMWSISCKTLEGPQRDLGPVEAVEGPKMAMLEKIGLVKLLTICLKMLGGIMKNNHHMEILITLPVIVFRELYDELFMTFLII